MGVCQITSVSGSQNSQGMRREDDHKYLPACRGRGGGKNEEMRKVDGIGCFHLGMTEDKRFCGGCRSVNQKSCSSELLSIVLLVQ